MVIGSVTVIIRSYRTHPNRYQVNGLLPFPSKSLPRKSYPVVPTQPNTVQNVEFPWLLIPPKQLPRTFSITNTVRYCQTNYRRVAERAAYNLQAGGRSRIRCSLCLFFFFLPSIKRKENLFSTKKITFFQPKREPFVLFDTHAR